MIVPTAAGRHSPSRRATPALPSARGRPTVMPSRNLPDTKGRPGGTAALPRGVRPARGKRDFLFIQAQPFSVQPADRCASDSRWLPFSW